MVKKGIWNATALYSCIIILLIAGVFALRDRQYIILLFTLIFISLLFFISLSKWKNIIDRAMSFLFPIALSISKVVWIAHPINSTVGVLSVGAGIYLCATDFIIIYFLFRLPFFNNKKANSRLMVYIYLFSAILSCIYAYRVEFALFGVLMLLKCYIVYRWFALYINKENIKFFLYGAETALLFQGFIGILQFFSSGPIGLTMLGENNDALRYRIVDGVINRGAAGTFEHSSKLAIFAIFVILLIIYNENKKIKKYSLSLFGMIVLYIAGSRTALFVFALSLVYSIWKQRTWVIKRKTAIIILITSVIIILISTIALKEGALDFIFNSDLFFQVMNRINHWILALSYIKSNIFFGYGLNNYAAKMTTINNTDFYYLNPVHNNYILNWFEIGLIGLISYIVILMSHIINLKNFKEEEGYKKFSVLFLLCVLIYNFTGWAFAAPPCIYLLWISLGLLDKKIEKEG